MVQITKEVREVYDEALAIGDAKTKESQRHRKFGERLMVRAAENVYAVHLLDLIKPDGFAPSRGGQRGREECVEAAKKGLTLTAKAYSMILGYSEAYVSRLYRLGFGLAAGVLDPDEKAPAGQKTRWQQVSRVLGDTPEVGAVLGKNVEVLPTVEALDNALVAATARRAADREQARLEPPSWIPSRPSEQIGMLYELAEVIHKGRTLTPRQIDQVREIMDGLRYLIEEWVEKEREANGGPPPRGRKAAKAG